MLSHLLELRKRLLFILISFAVFFLLFFCLSADLFYWLMTPLMKALPASSTLIATQITAPVFTPIKLAFNLAILASTPVALYQIWSFAAPGLYSQEKRRLRWVIVFSLVLFACGVLFCFSVVLPFMFHFFTQAVPKGVRLLPDMSPTLDFITRMLILFGLSFQVPLISLTLVRLGLMTRENLKNIRPYYIVTAFTVAMVLTPPDVFSQLILALPLCLLYELGILLTLFPKSSEKHIAEH